MNVKDELGIEQESVGKDGGKKIKRWKMGDEPIGKKIRFANHDAEVKKEVKIQQDQETLDILPNTQNQRQNHQDDNDEGEAEESNVKDELVSEHEHVEEAKNVKMRKRDVDEEVQVQIEQGALMEKADLEVPIKTESADVQIEQEALREKGDQEMAIKREGADVQIPAFDKLSVKQEQVFWR